MRNANMTRRRLQGLVVVPVVAVAVACGGGSSGGSQPSGGHDGGTSDGSSSSSGSSGGSSGSASSSGGGSSGSSSGGGDGGGLGEGGSSSGGDGSVPSGANVTPVIVNAGPPGTGSVDVPFVSVTFCVPGTSTCTTIDSISVDTGSSGLRVIASVLPSGFTLPQVNATTGSPLAECMQYADGYTWGSVRSADVKIGGEMAANIPVQVIGDPAFGTVPSDCSSSGPSEDTVADFGGNGIIGINQIIPDCGSYCSDTQNVGTGGYYSCAGTTCTAVAVADANQVANPIASFATDNNGAVLEFPSVPATGAATLAGSLVFGIGTQSNNPLGSATVQTVDADGNFTTIFNGKTLTQSYVDSGTNSFAFNDTSVTQCTGQLLGWYCPTSPVSLSAQNKGINGVTTTVSFTVADTETLFNTPDTAFDDLAGTGDNGSFAWGFPFFIGRNVFVGLDGATTPGGKGPYVAY
jgi:hypothetical protein